MGSSKPPKSEEELKYERDLKKAEKRREKEEKERIRRQQIEQQMEIKQKENMDEMAVSGSSVFMQINSLFKK